MQDRFASSQAWAKVKTGYGPARAGACDVHHSGHLLRAVRSGAVMLIIMRYAENNHERFRFLRQDLLEVAMNTDNDVRRDERRSIDFDFYKRRGERLRREAIHKLTGSTRKLLFGWLRQFRSTLRRGLVRP